MSKPLSIKERAGLATRSFIAPTAGESASAPSAATRTIRSGPANAILAMHSNTEVDAENRRLTQELKSWEGATPARRLDPALVEPSRWANRHDDSFSSPDFEELKADIASAGGNVQPIKVRPVAGTERYEIVYGHRRHRACKELGLPVFSIVESLNETELFAEMDRENRLREDLRPYEQGEMYRKALDEKLFPSLRRLAEALGVNLSSASRAVNIARLPREVLDAFPSRLDIQFRWTEPLIEASKSGDDFIQRARELAEARAGGASLSAKSVFDQLVGTVKPSKRHDVSVGGLMLFSVKEGRDKVTIELPKITAPKLKLIEDFIAKTIGEQAA